MVTPREIRVQNITTPWCRVSVTIAECTTTTTTTAAPSSSADPADGLTLLLLHGNSSSSRAFSHVLSQPPAGVSRVVAMDYPGHGHSADVGSLANAERVYTQAGYAVVAAHVLGALHARRVAVLGWSLGGHVAIELIPLLARASIDTDADLGVGPAPGTTPEPAPPADASDSADVALAGIMIVGTPPLGNAAQVAAGFAAGAGECAGARESRRGDEGRGGRERLDLSAFPLGAEVLTDEAVERVTVAGHGPPREQWMADGCRRTDGRARRIMAENMCAGETSDQVGIVGASDVLCAVVNGVDERFVNLDYVDGVKFRNLWRGERHKIPGTGHAPFWEAPDLFRDEYLEPFIKDCNAVRA